MSETLLKILKISAIVVVFSSLAITFSGFLLYIISLLTVAVNLSILSDIIAVVQMWLPFSIYPIIAWALTASSLYLTYRVAVYVYDYAHKFLSVG